VQKTSKMAEVFLDTAYAIALSSVSDLFHHRAVLLADQLEAAGTRLVTTQAILQDHNHTRRSPKGREVPKLRRFNLLGLSNRCPKALEC
jgi:predicted nucleic acid-binding protein